MNRKHWMIWALCLLLTVSLLGCSLTKPDTGTDPTLTKPTEPTTVPTEPTLPPPDPAELYAAGIAALGTDAAAMEITASQVMTVGGAEFTLDSVQSIAYWNLNSDSFIAQVSDTMDFGEYEYTLSETFGNEYVYQTLNDCSFMAQMDAQTFCERYPGLQLLDPALYELTMEGETKILFHNATGLEAWLAAEDMELNSAQATVTLSADGTVTGCTYEVDYQYGPAHYVTTYTVVYTKPGRAPALPQNTDDYLELESIDGMWLLDIAYGYLLQAEEYSTQKLSSIQSQAAAYVLNRQYNLNALPLAGADSDYRLETSIYAMDSSGSYDSDNDEKFIAGKYSSSVDGGRETFDNSVTGSVFKNYAQNFLIEDIFDTEMLTNAEITDLGSLIFVEYTCSEDMGLSICEYLNYELFNQPDLLGSVASSYTTNKMEYYLALDKYTMLPTAVGYHYEGCHRIEGQDCLLIEQMDQSFDLASLTAYEAIHEKTSPDVEPEVKPTPLFYHVTGADGQEMWLFGTIHVGDDRTGYLPEEIYEALGSSVALAVECDTEGFSEALEDDEKLQSKVSDLYYYDDGVIAEHLDTEDLYEYALKVLKATGNYFYNSDYQKASLWSSSIDNYYLSQGHSLTSEKGIESRLEDYAEENGIPLWEVESSLFQIEMLTGYSDHLQEFQLYNSAYGHGKASWEASEELYELWLSGDEAALIEEMERTSWGWTEEDFEDLEDLDEEEQARVQYILDNMESINEQLEVLRQEYVKAMETDRNAGMLEVAKDYLESGETVFFAVGLAHLLAEDGLVFALRDAGYTVELVTYGG